MPPEKITPVTLLNERNFGLFKLETTATYNNPFDVAKDTFTFRIIVKDDSENIIFPIKLTKILLKDGEVLFGEKQLDSLLTGVGDTITIKTPLFYILKQLEEDRRLTYQIDYEYMQRVKDERLPNGSYSYKNELVRDKYENRFTTKISFVKSGADK